MKENIDDNDNSKLILPDVNIKSLNTDQEKAFNIIMKTLCNYKKKPKDFSSYLRLIVAGTAGSGK